MWIKNFPFQNRIKCAHLKNNNFIEFINNVHKTTPIQLYCATSKANSVPMLTTSVQLGQCDYCGTTY
jgi:hypothetical protein